MSFTSATYSAGSQKSVLPIRPALQDYAWGIRGLDSRVARYALESGIIDEVDPDRPYAELWIGTHEKGHSALLDGTTLEQALGGPLPFLVRCHPLSYEYYLYFCAFANSCTPSFSTSNNPFFVVPLLNTQHNSSKCCRVAKLCQFKHILIKISQRGYMEITLQNMATLITNQKWQLHLLHLKPCAASDGSKKFRRC